MLPALALVLLLAENRAPEIYPANPGAKELIAAHAVLERLHLPGKLRFERITLTRFGLTVGAMRGFRDYQVSDRRQVYEIVMTFRGPYEERGMTWGSGTRVIVVDAETGNVIYGAIYAQLLRGEPHRIAVPAKAQH